MIETRLIAKRGRRYRVKNEFDETDTTLALNEVGVPITTSVSSVQDPVRFTFDREVYTIPRGDSIILEEGLVKYLIGDWDVDTEEAWEAEVNLLLLRHGYVPKLKIERLPEAEQPKSVLNTAPFNRPVIDDVLPEDDGIEVVEAEEGGFSEQAIQEAERRRRRGEG